MRLLEILRIILVSFESLFVGVVVVTYLYLPDFFVGIGSHFKKDDDVWRFIPSIPMILCVCSVKYAWKILMPLDGSSNRRLIEWPGYWKLKYRAIISVIICFACTFGSLSIWIYTFSLSELTVGAIFIASIIISLTVVFSQFLAALKVRELMEP